MSDESQGTWEDAEEILLRGALDATPAQRLAWLEEALRFAARAGALPRRDDSATADD